VLQSEPFVEPAAETAVPDAFAAVERTVDTRTGIARTEDLQEEAAEAAISGHGQPLDLVFVGLRMEAEKFRHPAIEIADGIGEILLLLDGERGAGGAPEGSTAEIASAVERQHGGFVERRGVIRRGRMRQVVLDDEDAAVGELRP